MTLARHGLTRSSFLATRRFKTTAAAGRKQKTLASMPRGRVALVATPQFKLKSATELRTFACTHLYKLCAHHDVVSTGRTHSELEALVDKPIGELADLGVLPSIAADLERTPRVESDLEPWRARIRGGLVKYQVGLRGLIEIANDLVEHRLDALILLHEPEDLTSKPGVLVLRREANVHDVAVASDLASADALAVRFASGDRAVTRERERHAAPGEDFGDRESVIALIAHDGKKLDLCCFVIEHFERLMQFDRILATGTTGMWIQRFLAARGARPEQLERVRPYLSGPRGGDVQLARALLAGRCHTVIFFEDPLAAPAHEVDVCLFAQAVLESPHVRLATNAATARLLLAEPRSTTRRPSSRNGGAA